MQTATHSGKMVRTGSTGKRRGVERLMERATVYGRKCGMPNETTDTTVDAYAAADLIINLLRQIGLDSNDQIAALGGAMSAVFSEVNPRRRQTLFGAHNHLLRLALVHGPEVGGKSCCRSSGIKRTHSAAAKSSTGHFRRSEED